METQTDNHKPGHGQLILVPRKDTVRLLEVYVKRSLSLNDGSLGDKKARRKEKWVTVPRKHRLHSSDPSIHLIEDLNDEDIGPFSAVESSTKEPETIYEEPEKPTKKLTKKSKKNKKPSFWKNVIGFFSRLGSEEKSEDEDGPAETPAVPQAEEPFDSLSTCLPTTPVASQKRKLMRKKSKMRRLSKRRISLKNKSIHLTDITRVDGKCGRPDMPTKFDPRNNR